jgi:hypothetical protein
MAISFVADGGYDWNNIAGTSISWTYSKPVGTAVGDLLIIFASARGDGGVTPTVPTPTGFTLVTSTGPGINSGYNLNLYAFWRIADASDVSGSTYSVTANCSSATNTYIEANVRGYRGTASVSPINGFITHVETTSISTHVLPAVTNEGAFVSGEWYVAAAVSPANQIPAGGTPTSPALSHILSVNTGGPDGYYIGDLIPASSAPGAETFDYNSISTPGRLALGLTIKPLASVGPTVILQSQACL